MTAEDRDQLASELEEFGYRETDDPDTADQRRYYKVEKWDADELHVEALLYAPEALTQLLERMQYGEHYSLYVAPSLVIGLYLIWAGFTAHTPNARLK
jgi:hypothetical protein